MRQRSLLQLLLLLPLLLAPILAAARGRHVNSDSGDFTDCNQYHVNFGDFEGAVLAEQQLTAPGGSNLRVHAGKNGGIAVRGGSGKDYAIKVCKFARPSTEGLLQQINARLENGELSVEGPSGLHDWTAHILIQAPKGANMQLDSRNGPISIRQVTGTIRADATNGPVSVRDSSGDIEVNTQNGPIDFSGNDGNLRLQAHNGPITVDLLGSEWRGQGLEARTQNGPVSVMLPASYHSGVRVEATGHSPFTCDAEICGGGRRDWDDHRRSIQFGGDNPVVRISTVNGPVSIESRQASD